jgi:hypothetical protein
MLLSLSHPSYFTLENVGVNSEHLLMPGFSILHLMVLVACCSNQRSPCCSSTLSSATADLPCWENLCVCFFFTPDLTSVASKLNIYVAVFTRDAWPSHWSQKVHMLLGSNVQTFYIASHQKPSNPVGRAIHIQHSSQPRWLLGVVLKVPESWDSKIQPWVPKDSEPRMTDKSQEQFTRPNRLTSWLLTLQQWLLFVWC